MHRRHTFIKDGFLTITTVSIFCFLFLFANAYQGDTQNTNKLSLVTKIENEPQVLLTSNNIHNNLSVAVPTADALVPQEETEIETPVIEKDDSEHKVVFKEPVAVDTKVEVEKEIIEEKAIVTPKTIATKVSTLPKVVTATKPAVKNEVIAVTLSESSDSGYINEITKLIEQKTNTFRVEEGLLPLSHDNALEKNAKDYSESMQAAKRISHTSTDGCGLTCRFARDEYKAYSWGENLATMGFSKKPSAEKIASFFMSEWEKSAGHRENLISPLFTNHGIGIAVSPTSVYATVHFSKPR